MKKILSVLMAAALCASMAACSSSDNSSSVAENGNIQIDTLRVAFVPSREPDEIITATEPLKEMLKTELAKEGYDVGNVEITVGTSYEAVGESLSAGTADVGLIPGGTYVLYDDGAEVILTATRDGLSIDSDSAKDWNDNKPTEATTDQAVSYRALIIAGPSEKGQELGAKVNAGEGTDLGRSEQRKVERNVSLFAGWLHLSGLWLQENYGKGITDLAYAVPSDSYGSAMARLASVRWMRRYPMPMSVVTIPYQWQSEYGRTASIWTKPMSLV